MVMIDVPELLTLTVTVVAVMVKSRNWKRTLVV